jgi:DNA repair exonuclease SbcCD ATPase subunit
MSMAIQFQKLDDLIIEHTQPPVRTILRSQLALAQEQIEAYQASSDKQDETLAKQAETIERLMKENSEEKAKLNEIVLSLNQQNFPTPVKFPKPGIDYEADKRKKRTN